MSDIPETKGEYQAQVHFALGAVIQGITVAALGNEVAGALRALPFPGAIWVFITGLQSLLLCIAFWYNFMDNYFFGFRVARLTAKTHFFSATLYLILGLQQLMAIHFLDLPRLWMTFYVLLILTTFAGALIFRHAMLHVDDENVRQTLEYDPGSRFFSLIFLLLLVLLILWYVLPGIDTNPFRAVVLSISGLHLVFFIIQAIKIFQRHLDIE
jgi:hypothetical protein